LLPFADPHVGLLRSVVLNKEDRVISIAPSKSIPFDSFCKKYKRENLQQEDAMQEEVEYKMEDLIAEEFIDGTMINVFWDPCIGISGSWEIATRSIVGANMTFFKSYVNTAETTKKVNTFREMFLDAAEYNDFDFDILDKKYNYSFVLQHPNNRIVVPFEKPQLYLFQVYEIVHIHPLTQNQKGQQEQEENQKREEGQEQIRIYQIPMEKIREQEVWKMTQIKFPLMYSKGITNYEDLKKSYASMDTSYNIVGVMIYNKKTLERTKMRNPGYEYGRRLKGNQPKLQYHYLCLRREGKVDDYLKYYPEDKKEFSFYRDTIHEFTALLIKNYISCYIKKEKPLKEYGENMRTHMFVIHRNYVDHLKPQNLYVSYPFVIRYVNNLHPNLLMHALNYPLRQRQQDLEQVEQVESSN
jgi:hypothetical protein